MKDESRIFDFFMNAPAAIAIVHGPDHVFTFANPRYQQIFSRDLGQLLNRSIRQVWPEIEDQGIYEVFDSVFNTGTPFIARDFPATIEDNGGQKTGYYDYTVHPVKDEQGRVTDIMIHAVDVTDRVTASRKAEQLAWLTRSISDAVITTDKDHRITGWNEGAEEIYGWKAEEVIGKDARDVVPPTFREGERAQWEQSFRDTGKWVGEVVQRRRNGDEIHIHASISTMKNSRGEVVGAIAVNRNITALKVAEQTIRLNEEKLRLAVEAGELGTYDYYPQTDKLHWSAKTKEFFGLPADAEVNYETFLNGIHPDDRQRSDAVVKKAYEQGSTGVYENEYRTIGITDGRVRWIRSKGRIIFDEHRNPVRFTGITQDITGQKEMLTSLQLQSLVLDRMDEGVCVADENGIIMLTNPAEDRMFGYMPGELLGKHVSIQNAYPPSENESIVKKVIEQLKTQGYWNGEWHNRKKSGEHFYTYASITSLEVDGRSLFICVQRDITEEKRYKDHLKESEERFRNLTETLPQLVWVTNAKGEQEYISKQWFDFTGTDSVDDSMWGNIVHPDDMQQITERWRECLDSGNTYHGEVRLKHHTGEYRWHIVQGHPVKNGEGKVVKWIGAFTDIHDQKTLSEKLEMLVKERTEELNRSNEELQRSNFDLQQFAHVTSHDLKEPVRKIKMFGGLLEEELGDNVSPSAAKYLQKLQNAATRISSLIDAILRYSYVDSVQEPFTTVNLQEVMEKIVEDLEVLISQTSARVHFKALPSIEGIPVLIHQLFYNLINNSLKFRSVARSPVISVEATLVQGNDQTVGLLRSVDYVQIDIHDNGIGFKSVYAHKIFDTFARLNSKDKYEGTGLGLALCKKIVERHHGIVRAIGKEDEGATFTVILPTTQKTKF